MKVSTGDNGIRTIDVHEGEELVPALTCGDCEETFPWVDDRLPTFCPRCGRRSQAGEVCHFVSDEELTDDA